VAFAYDVLSDAEKRARYDEFGMAGLAEGFDPEQARAYARWSQGAHRSPNHESFAQDLDLEDLLSGFFGGQRGAGGFGARRGPRPGRDAHGSLSVEFLDAVRGGEVRLQYQGRNLRVRIPPGADDGTRIRMTGQGEPGEGGPAGDLYLTLQVRPHPFFTRRGADLHLDLPVTIPELVLGASVEVPTPDDPVSMKIPPHSANGRVLRLRGKGATRRDGAECGDLYIKLRRPLHQARGHPAQRSGGPARGGGARDGGPLRGPGPPRAAQGDRMSSYTRRQLLEILEIEDTFLVALEHEEIVLDDARTGPDPGYSERMLERARVAHNLVQELDVNLPGVSIILRMREEIADLRHQMAEVLGELKRRGR
jgi:curved DNA-binding protein